LTLSLFALCAEERWFISNAAGMALEPAFSGLALRHKYALKADQVFAPELPERLREFYSPTYSLELRILYLNGEESRRQYLMMDADGRIRVVAVLSDASAAADEGPVLDAAASEVEVAEVEVSEAEVSEASPSDGEDAAGEAPTETGFIEIYNEANHIAAEHRLERDGTDWVTSFFYNNQTLVRAETQVKRPAVGEEASVLEDYCTDYYRYSRSASLRAVERVYHRQAAEGDERVRLPFPHMVLEAARTSDFVSPAVLLSSEFLQDILMEGGYRIVYTTDERGRVLAETRRDDEGEILGELRNTWAGDRLKRVQWVSGEDDRVTEYEYNDEGDRILERNINKGVLERVVRRSGDREIEELYMDGRVVLRATWENGRKISEERVRDSKPLDAFREEG
jgi:hypothetical protein